jgi:hypothetical protein
LLIAGYWPRNIWRWAVFSFLVCYYLIFSLFLCPVSTGTAQLIGKSGKICEAVQAMYIHSANTIDVCNIQFADNIISAETLRVDESPDVFVVFSHAIITLHKKRDQNK